MINRQKIIRSTGLLAGALAVSGCRTRPPMPTVAFVDLQRFMGAWHVIAHIPAGVEKQAWGGIESYRLADDGTIETTYAFRRGGFDGPVKTYHPRGFVRNNETNAEWGMQFVWPFKAEYLIIYLDEDYTRTIIGRTARDYAWIMTREPVLPEAELQELIAFLGQRGYDTLSVRRVPQLDPPAGGASTHSMTGSGDAFDNAATISGALTGGTP